MNLLQKSQGNRMKVSSSFEFHDFEYTRTAVLSPRKCKYLTDVSHGVSTCKILETNTVFYTNLDVREINIVRDSCSVIKNIILLNI